MQNRVNFLFVFLTQKLTNCFAVDVFPYSCFLCSLHPLTIRLFSYKCFDSISAASSKMKLAEREKKFIYH